MFGGKRGDTSMLDEGNDVSLAVSIPFTIFIAILLYTIQHNLLKSGCLHHTKRTTRIDFTIKTVSC